MPSHTRRLPVSPSLRPHTQSYTLNWVAKRTTALRSSLLIGISLQTVEIIAKPVSQFLRQSIRSYTVFPFLFSIIPLFLSQSFSHIFPSVAIVTWNGCSTGSEWGSALAACEIHWNTWWFLKHTKIQFERVNVPDCMESKTTVIVFKYYFFIFPNHFHSSEVSILSEYKNHERSIFLT